MNIVKAGGMPVQVHHAPPDAAIPPARFFGPDAGPGQGKPRGGFWTSTYTGPESISAWAEYVRELHGDGPMSFDLWRLDPEPDARVLVVRTRRDLSELADRYPDGFAYPAELSARYGGRIDPGTMPRGIDWSALSGDIDAVWAPSPSYDLAAAVMGGRSGEPDFHAWDSESTCWFRWCFTGASLLAQVRGGPHWRKAIEDLAAPLRVPMHRRRAGRDGR